MNILLADDHPFFRDALTLYIERTCPDVQVLSARDYGAVERVLAAGTGIDVILLDRRLSGARNFENLKTLRDKHSDIPVLLMVANTDDQDKAQVKDMGAAGYLQKNIPGKIIVEIVREVASGRSFFGGYIVPIAELSEPQDAMAREIRAAITSLTPRETEVLCCLMRGDSNKDIAETLRIQVVTVKLHVKGICRKFGVKNRTQAALMAKELGIQNRAG